MNTCVLSGFLDERVRQKGRWRQAERHREADALTGSPRGGDAEKRRGAAAPAAAGRRTDRTERPPRPCLLRLSTVAQRQGPLSE